MISCFENNSAAETVGLKTADILAYVKGENLELETTNGQVLDVTESRVSQLHTQAIMKLKAKLKNDFESHEDIAV